MSGSSASEQQSQQQQLALPHNDEEAPQQSKRCCAGVDGASVKAFVIKNYLPLGFCLALLIGLSFPAPGAWLGGLKVGSYKAVQSVCIILIFIISGLTLKTSEVTAAIKALVAFSYALVAILFITPLAGLAVSQIPFSEPAFAIGFTVFCCVPTTLTSGVTLATQAGGNGALALMMTVTTNIVGVFTTPLMLSFVLGVSGTSTEGTGDITFDTGALILKLCITILAPTIIGKLIRESHSSVAEWVAKNKTSLSLSNNSLLIIIVWMTISAGQEDILSQDALTLVLVVITGIVLHLVFLAVNGIAVWALAITTPERKSVHILTSQKTLPVAVTVLSFLPASLGSPGLLTIPCLIGHISQLFIDAFLVSSNSFDRPFLLFGPVPNDEELPPPCCCWRKRHKPLVPADSEEPLSTSQEGTAGSV